MSEKTIVIDCGLSVIKIVQATDHAHITIVSESFTGDNGYHEPAQSASVAVDPQDAQKVIDALSPLTKAKPALKSVPKETH